MSVKRLVGFAALCMIGTQAYAVTTAFDFASGQPGSASLGVSTVTVDSVTANAWIYGGGTSYTASTLWVRNQTNDHGLGICSVNEPCSTGGGDYNELSTLTNLEVLQLTRPDDTKWVSVFVSSLDANGGPTVEDGTLYYSDTLKPNLSSTSFVQFKSGDFGSSVEGNLFSLFSGATLSALQSAKYLYFKPGAPGVNSDNNDFLVWKGAIESINPPSDVPEPSTYMMLLAGLGMLGFMVKRRTNG